VSSVIESIGVVAARASFRARRAWRQMVLDACVGLFLVLMLTIAGGLLIYAAFAFAQTLMPDYAAALSLAVLIGLLCAVVYYAVYVRDDERRSTAAQPVAQASVTADAAASLPPSAVSLALMTALTVARLCGRSRTRSGC
jgi:predicted lipid-binding transport protein (Tim44 family)